MNLSKKEGKATHEYSKNEIIVRSKELQSKNVSVENQQLLSSHSEHLPAIKFVKHEKEQLHRNGTSCCLNTRVLYRSIVLEEAHAYMSFSSLHTSTRANRRPAVSIRVIKKAVGCTLWQYKVCHG